MNGIILTDEQEHLIDELSKWFHDYESGHRYRDHAQWYSYSGQAGSGKTAIISFLVDRLNLQEDEYITCAYTGKASLNLQQKDLRSCTILLFIIQFLKKKLLLMKKLNPDCLLLK